MNVIVTCIILFISWNCSAQVDKAKQASEVYQRFLVEKLQVEAEVARAMAQELFINNRIVWDNHRLDIFFKELNYHQEYKIKKAQTSSRLLELQKINLETRLSFEKLSQELLKIEPAISPLMNSPRSPLMTNNRIGVLIQELSNRIHQPLYRVELISDYNPILNACQSDVKKQFLTQKGYRLLTLSPEASSLYELIYFPFSGNQESELDGSKILMFKDGAGVINQNLDWKKVPIIQMEDLIRWTDENFFYLKYLTGFDLALFWPMSNLERQQARLNQDRSLYIEKDLRHVVGTFDECVIKKTFDVLKDNNDLLAKSFQLLYFAKENLSQDSLKYHQYFQLLAMFRELSKLINEAHLPDPDKDPQHPTYILYQNMKSLEEFLVQRYRDLFRPTDLPDADFVRIAETTLSILEDFKSSIINNQQNFAQARSSTSDASRLDTPGNYYSRIRNDSRLMVQVLTQFNQGTRLRENITSKPELLNRVLSFIAFSDLTIQWLKDNANFNNQ